MFKEQSRNFAYKGRNYHFDHNDRLLVEQSCGSKFVSNQTALLAEIELENEREKREKSGRSYGGVTPERVAAVKELLREQVMTTEDISEALKIHPATIRWCLKELKDNGIIAPNYYKFLD